MSLLMLSLSGSLEFFFDIHEIGVCFNFWCKKIGTSCQQVLLESCICQVDNDLKLMSLEAIYMCVICAVLGVALKSAIISNSHWMVKCTSYVKLFFKWQWRIQDPGATTYHFGQFSQKTAWKWKKNWTGGARPWIRLWMIQDSMDVFTLCDCHNITNSYVTHYKQKQIAVAIRKKRTVWIRLNKWHSSQQK